MEPGESGLSTTDRGGRLWRSAFVTSSEITRAASSQSWAMPHLRSVAIVKCLASVTDSGSGSRT
jgi:hypothetical protein